MQRLHDTLQTGPAQLDNHQQLWQQHEQQQCQQQQCQQQQQQQHEQLLWQQLQCQQQPSGHDQEAGLDLLQQLSHQPHGCNVAEPTCWADSCPGAACSETMVLVPRVISAKEYAVQEHTTLLKKFGTEPSQ